MDKFSKYTVSVIIKSANTSEEFLAVHRLSDDKDLGGEWGFPAASLVPGELPEECSRRICKIKLDCEG